MSVNQARHIGIGKRGRLPVLQMEAEQILIEPQGLKDWRVRVRGFDLPRDELLGWIEYRAAGQNLERILRLGRALFARCIKLQRFLSDEIVERGTIGIRQTPDV